MPSGGGEAGFDPKLWVIVDLEKNEAIIGQFAPQNVQKRLGGVIAEEPTVGRQNPIVQWIHGLTEQITFEARFWAHDLLDFTVEERLQRLQELVKRQDDQPKGRPPICSFAWGQDPSLFMEKCLVKDIGGITVDEIRGDGTMRGATLQITLIRYEEVTLEPTDPSVSERNTRIRRAKKGDTYESIALDEYGDPELGILLRQLNPRIAGMPLADLNPLNPVHAYREEYLLTKTIEPEFAPLKTGRGNEAAEERRREMFDARDDDSFTTTFPDGSKNEF